MGKDTKGAKEGPEHSPLNTIAWIPLREDGTIPYWYCAEPRVIPLPDLGSVIPPAGSAFGRYGRGWIANAPLSLHLKQRVFDALPSLLPDCPDPAMEALSWADSVFSGAAKEQSAQEGLNQRPGPVKNQQDSPTDLLSEESMQKHPGRKNQPIDIRGLPSRVKSTKQRHALVNLPQYSPRFLSKDDEDLTYCAVPVELRGQPEFLGRVEETPEDGCVDFSRFSFVPEYTVAYACCALRAGVEQEIEAVVPVLGPYGVGVNGEWVFLREKPFGYVEPEWVPIQIPLRKGFNSLVLFAQMIGWREARIVLGMRVRKGPLGGTEPSPSGGLGGLQAGIPILEGNPVQWWRDMDFLSRLGVRQFSFPEGKIILFIDHKNSHPGSKLVPRKHTLEVEFTFPRLESGGEGETSTTAYPSWKARLDIGAGTEKTDPTGNPAIRKIVLNPDPAFLQALRRFPPHIPLSVKAHVGGSPYGGKRVGEVYLPRYPYSEEPFGEYFSRKTEALEVLSEIEETPFGALAAIALGKRIGVGKGVLRTSIDFLKERRDCADFYALALIVALYTFGSENSGSIGGRKILRRGAGRGPLEVRGIEWGSEATRGRVTGVVERGSLLPPEEKEAIREALLGFKYWHNEGGVDAMCWFTENHQIIFHTAGYLAGSFFPREVFMSSGVTGRKLAERCARRIVAWILPRLQGGYSEWDSNTYLAMDIYALLALAEYAPSERIRRLAVTLLDKTFFMIACQSLRGAHGCSHGRCYTEGLKTARVESTSGLQRIAWGMGGFNGETWATGMLALAERYQVHPLVQAIGADMPPLLETESCSYGTYYLQRDLRKGSWEVHTLTRRTPHYLLSAALDHRPGERGIQEHLWQLTFSPEAVLFTTWPGNSQEHGNARPNYWAGSARLPRVALVGRSLICLYDPEGKAGMGFGHAYCPREAYDEVMEREGWVFVRYGKGYGALRSDGDLYWVRTGPHAYQELRSKGGGKVFLAAAGSEEEDGDFYTFQKKCLASQPSMQGGWAAWNTMEGLAAEGQTWEGDVLHGQALEGQTRGRQAMEKQAREGRRVEFSWRGPFRVNGEEKSLRVPWHYKNQYTSTPLSSRTMVLAKGEETLTLDLTL